MKQPQDEARELVDRFMNLKPTKLSDYSKIYSPMAKELALIVIEGRIESSINILKHDKERYGITSRGSAIELHHLELIREEIEKL
jgi:hypothetical protein